ncbi:MAG: hypothetical protein ACRC5T_13155 [Cetobacterium sp.]
MESINKNKLKICAWISTCALTFLISRGSILYILLGIVLSSITSYILIFHKKILDKIYFPKQKIELILFSVFTILSLEVFVKSFASTYINSQKFQAISKKIALENNVLLIKLIAIFIGLISAFALFLFWSYFIKKYYIELDRFFKNLKKDEKISLTIFLLFFSTLAVFTFTKTNLFYMPESSGKIYNYDILFTSDTAYQYISNVFMNIGAPENDLRQPLFGLYSLPIGTSAYIISKIFFFIPNSFGLFLQIFQILMLGISLILLGRLMKLEKPFEKVLFYIFISVSYSFLIWSLPLEQYVICYFFLILFVYDSLGKRKYENLLYIGATGTLLTSGIVFPLLFHKIDIKSIAKKILEIGLLFLTTIILIGQSAIIFSSISRFLTLTKYMGIRLDFIDKFKQFSNFVYMCFLTPKTLIKNIDGKISIQLEPVTSVNIFGLLLLIFMIIGIIFYYKDKFMRICFGWVVFSFIILCIIGWGTEENGLILYGLYFSWAYVALTFKILQKLFKSKKIFYPIMMIIILTMSIINITGFKKLVDFGIQYYSK